MSYLFTSESVSEGHPDKIADQISDAILDAYLSIDTESKVACETLVTTDLVIISGEITSKADINIIGIVKNVIKKIGYTKEEYLFSFENCRIETYIDKQSPDINQGVVSDKGLYKEEGAGDQGIMFGYATNETSDYMPVSLNLSHIILEELAKIRKEGKFMTYLRPDSKSQVTIEYSERNIPNKIDSIVISTQHDEFDENDIMLAKIKSDIEKFLIPRVKEQVSDETKKLFIQETNLHVNPTGKFVIGGPHGDTGLTGRKIIVDTYGGKGAHGGGAFSGKDPSKVDRSAAYATRHVAKNLVASGIADEILVQVAYAIGIARPISIYVNTYGTCKLNMTDNEIAKKINQIFDLTPKGIINYFKLKNPIYFKTSSYGHMGRKPKKNTYHLVNNEEVITKEIELFPWEKLDYVEKIKQHFNIK